MMTGCLDTSASLCSPMPLTSSEVEHDDGGRPMLVRSMDAASDALAHGQRCASWQLQMVSLQSFAWRQGCGNGKRQLAWRDARMKRRCGLMVIPMH